MSVSRGGLNLEDPSLDRENRHVERAATEVEDKNILLLAFLVEAVRDSRGRGLVDDSHYVEAGDGTSILGGLSLGVVEVRGHGDHRVLHLPWHIVVERIFI